MKILVVSDKDKIIDKIPLNKDQFFIGRSAICDILLRRKDVKEIHYTVKKKTQSDPLNAVINNSQNNLPDLPETPEEEQWVIFLNSDENSYYHEFILKSDKLQLDALFFSIEDDRRTINLKQDRRNRKTYNDRRQTPELKKGKLAENLREEEEYNEESVDKKLILEVIFIKISLNSVTNIAHLSGQNKKWRCFASIPELFLTLDKDNQLQLRGIQKEFPFKIFISGIDYTNTVKSNSDYLFNRTDQLNIQIADVEYIIRFVKRQKYSIKKRSIFEDKLFLVSSTALVVVFAFAILLKFIPLPPEKVTQKVSRVIRVEKFEVKKDEVIPPVVKLPELKPQVLPMQDMEPKTKPKPQPQIQHQAKQIPAPTKKQENSLLQFLKNKKTQSTGSNSLEASALGGKQTSNSSAATFLTSQNSNLKITGSNSQTHSENLEDASTTIGEINTKNDIKLNKQNLAFQGGVGEGNLNKMGKTNTGLGGKAGKYSLSVSGALTQDSILQTLRANSAGLTGCHNTALLRDPNLQGILTYGWTITGEGAVINLELLATSIEDSSFQVCIEDVLRGIKFQTNSSGVFTKVVNPFKFIPRDN